MLGADSASTVIGPRGATHMDYAQKLFEVGKSPSCIGLAMWGLGSAGKDSHRTIAARLGAAHSATPYTSLQDMAVALGAMVWEGVTTHFVGEINFVRTVESQGDAAAQEDRKRANDLRQSLSGGYCLAGRVADYGPCSAFEVLWNIDRVTPTLLNENTPHFWGVPHIAQRLLYGVDIDGLMRINNSGKWSGSIDELVAASSENAIDLSDLPIREAIDWIHLVIQLTIRGTKFARLPHWCGGPIEIGAITTDRPFRWVRHKRLDAAIAYGEV